MDSWWYFWLFSLCAGSFAALVGYLGRSTMGVNVAVGEIKTAVFSVSVDNEAEIRQWLDDIGKSRDALETLFGAFVELAQNRPLIRLTLHHQGSEVDKET